MKQPEFDVAEERVVASERLYEGRVINLRIDHIVADGDSSKQYRREVVEHVGASVIIAQPDFDHMVLVRQWRHAAGIRTWEIPAGTLDPNESPIVCAARELREETGFTAGRLLPLFAGYSAPGFSAELLHFFHATELVAGKSDPDEGEEIFMHIFSLDELQVALHAGELLDAKTQTAVLWALLERERTR